MADDVKDTEAEGVETEPDVADEEDLDVEIQRVAPKRSGGCGAVGWVIFIIILAAIAFFVGLKIKEQRDEDARKAKEARELAYAAQEATITDNVKKAAEIAAKGDIETAVKELATAESKWGQLAANANSSKDTEKAQVAAGRKSSLNKVLKELESDQKKAADLDAQAKALQDERDALNAKVRDRIMELAGAGATGGAPEGQNEAGSAPAAQSASPASAQPAG